MTKWLLIALVPYMVCSALSAGELGDWNVENLDVAIQATRLSHSKFRTPAAVTVLTQDNIKHRGFLAVHDIFRDVPGFRVSVIGSEKRVSYHGTAVRQNRRMRVSINGINALIGDGGYVEFNRLPFTVDDISKITITRGTNGGSYGDNAFLANIDFQLKSALHGRGTGVTVGSGDLKRRNVTAFVNKRFENYSLSLSANRYGIEEHAKRGIPAIDNEPDEDISRVNLTITSGPTKKNPWEVNLQWYEASHNIGGTFVSPDIGEQLNRGLSLSISQEINLSDHQHIDWSLNHSRQKEKLNNYACFDELLENYLDGAEQGQRDSLIARASAASAILQRPFEDLCGSIAFAIKSRRADAEAEYNHMIGSLNFAVGGSATSIEAESDEYFSERETQQSYRLFGEAAYDLRDVTLHFGAMAQKATNVEDTQFAGRLAANWQYKDDQSLRVALSEGFRIPSLVESEASWSVDIVINDASIPGYDGSLDVAANGPTVRPERIRSYEIGHFIALSGLGLKLDTKLFRDDIRDPIESTFILRAVLPANRANYTMTGFETELEYQLTRHIKLRGTYSYLDTTAESIFERGLYGRHAGSLVGQFKLRDKDSVSLAYYGNTDIGEVDFDRFDLVYNWRARFTSTNLNVRLVAQYFLNKDQGNELDGQKIYSIKSFDDATQIYLQCELHW